MKSSLPQSAKDYLRITRAIEFIDAHLESQPSLFQIAQAAGLSEFHFQRVFQRWAGISPKKFLQFLTKEHAKQLLEKSNVLDSSLDAGLSGSSRLHDLFVSCEAMSPGEFKQKGKGLIIDYGFSPTSFGECFIAQTNRGICSLLFLEKSQRSKVISDFKRKWKNASLNFNRMKSNQTIRKVFIRSKSKKQFSVLCSGTNFQIKVWEALLCIPPGRIVSYKNIAEIIGSPKAVRAVGTAIGNNPIAYLIPCHRVIRSMGHLGGYRWGLARKRAMILKESFLNNSQGSGLEI